MVLFRDFKTLLCSEKKANNLLFLLESESVKRKQKRKVDGPYPKLKSSDDHADEAAGK